MYNLLLYKVEKPSVRLSVRLSVLYADNSVMPAWIDAGLARRDRYVLKFIFKSGL